MGSSSTFNGLLEPEFAVSNLNLEEAKFNARLAGGVSGPVELGFGINYSNSFGPLGNIVLSGQADLLTDARFQTTVTAQGVIGPVAGSAKARVFNSFTGLFQAETAFSQPSFAFNQQLGLELEVKTRYRLDRTTIIDGNLDLFYLFEDGFGGEINARYNLLKMLERDDGAILAKVYGSPGFASGYAAAGFAYNVNRTDWPDIQAEVWLGAGTKGIWPGIDVKLAERLDDSQTAVGLEANLEPYLIDQSYVRALAYFDQALDYGNLHLALGIRTESEQVLGLINLVYSFDLKN
jgi:hypothetical protein